ncbi:MAG: DHH family phosphoesterase [Methanobacteriota archaeon]
MSVKSATMHGLPPEMAKRVKTAAELVRGGAPFVRVVSHYDADGISAAGVLCRALHRRGAQFHATLARKFDAPFFEALSAEGNALTIISDAGSAQIDLVERLPGNVIVLDHHAPKRESERVVQVNPHFFGVDGATELCAASLAYAFAYELDICNADLFPYALAGIIGDKQSLGGFKGVNAALVAHSIEGGSVVQEKGISLRGATISKGIADSINPYFLGLTGNPAAASKFLSESGLDDGAPKDLEGESMRLLASLLTLRLLESNVHPESVAEFTAPRFACPKLGMDAAELSALVNASGRMDEPEVGLGACLGDLASLEKAKILRKAYRSRLKDGLVRLEREGAKELKAIQYFRTEGATFAGSEAGLGIQFILRKDKPVFAISPDGGETSISARGNRAMVARGLHLGKVCALAENLGGRGGGHNVASGANVPSGKEDEFLALADELVLKQMGPAE